MAQQDSSSRNHTTTGAATPKRAAPNAARNAEIVRRREAGEWPTEIAKAMGVSRNAVIGALNRAGRCRPDIDRSALMKRFAKWPIGEQCGGAKLSESEVRAIRREYEPFSRTLGARALARRYGVCPDTIHKITTRRRWVHVA